MKKKIIVYVENYSFGGLEKFVCDFIQNNFNNDILLIANKDNDRLENFAKNNNITFLPVNIHSIHSSEKLSGFIKLFVQTIDVFRRYIYFFRNIFYLKNIFTTLKYYDHILIVNGGYPGAMSCLSATIAAKKVAFKTIGLSILSCPSTTYYRLPLRFIQNVIDKWVSDSVTFFHVNSHVIKNDLLKMTCFDQNKIHIVYTGVSVPDNISKIATLELPICTIKKQENEIWFGMISILGSTKTQDILLEAIALVLPNHPELHCLIVGDGPKYAMLKELTTNLGIEKNIIFCGQSEEHEQIYRFLDACIFSSSHEGLPYAVSEAMAYALPLIASNVGGVSEQIDDSINGFLVPKQDAKSLAKKIEILLNNRSIWPELGQNARTKAIEHFSIETMRKNIDLLL